MKNILFLIALFAAVSRLAGQSESAELDWISAQIKAGALSGPDATAKVRAFKSAVKTVGGYPAVPFDTATNSIQIEFVIDLPSTPKKVIFNRAKEWFALNYADLDAVLKYENFDDGKIVVKGYSNITRTTTYTGFFGGQRQQFSTAKLYYATIATVKDNALKITVFNPYYEFLYGGFWLNNVYTPTTTSKSTMESLFPIAALADERSMVDNLYFLRRTIAIFDATQKSLAQYIRSYASDYRF